MSSAAKSHTAEKSRPSNWRVLFTFGNQFGDPITDYSAVKNCAALLERAFLLCAALRVALRGLIDAVADRKKLRQMPEDSARALAWASSALDPLSWVPFAERREAPAFTWTYSRQTGLVPQPASKGRESSLHGQVSGGSQQITTITALSELSRRDGQDQENESRQGPQECV